MKINKNLIASSKVINLIFIATCLLVLANVIWSPKAFSNRGINSSQQQKQPLTKAEYEAMVEKLDPNGLPVRNMTRALKLISIEKIDGGMLRLTLRNEYRKGIDGVEISMANVGIHKEFGFSKENIIPPQGTCVIELPIQEHTDTDGIEIAAVIFEDGTADGNLEYVKPVEEQRLGERTQFKRALALIQKQLTEPNAETIEGLNRLESQLQSLPVHEGDGKRGDYEIGLEQAKKLMVVTIQIIRDRQSQSAQSLPNTQNRQPNISIRAELSNIINEYKKIVPEF